MDEFKKKIDPNCEEIICKQQSLFNKYKNYISKDLDDEEEDSIQSKDPKNDYAECPIGKDALGFYTWNYLHTLAAYYPSKPSDKEKPLMKNLIESFAYFYPCKVCSVDFQKDLKNSKNFGKITTNYDFLLILRPNKTGLLQGIFDLALRET